MLVNTAIEDYSIAKLKAVVLDELHMVDDQHRGYTLELIATKLLSLENPVQIIAMSATVPVSSSRAARSQAQAKFIIRTWTSWPAGSTPTPMKRAIGRYR